MATKRTELPCYKKSLARQKERYANDEEYRETCKKRNREYYRMCAADPEWKIARAAYQREYYNKKKNKL